MANDVKTSKALSWLLRHGAKQCNVSIDARGFVAVDKILSLPQFKHIDVSTIQRIVSTNEKQRFALEQRDGMLYIRANQGHTLTIDNLDLIPITEANMPSRCIHGTRFEVWPSIRVEGLSRMKRQHIHMASGMPRDNKVISGMRQSCDLIIHVDIEQALADGIVFYLSANNVILSPGDATGHIPPRYFTRVQRRQQNQWIDVI